MATLYIRDVPEELYEALKAAAAHDECSISAQAIRLLRRSLHAKRAAVQRLMEEIEHDRPKVRAGTPSAAALIRKDRDAG